MKKKIVIYSVIMFVFLVFVGIGIVDLIIKTKYANNEITFNIQNKDAYFIVNANYYYGKTQEPTKTYKARYLEEDNLNGLASKVDAWNIGESKFVVDDNNNENTIDVFTYVFEITNKNSQKNLEVKISDVAANPNTYFSTQIEYKNGSHDKRTMFSNLPNNEVNKGQYLNSAGDKVSISTPEIIEPDQVLQITITVKLQNYAQAINTLNNFSISLNSVNA